MKMILILTSLLSLTTSAQAKQYVVHVNHVQNLQPSHTVLNTLLQKDITIDTSSKTVKLRLSPACTQSNVCPEMLNFYRLELKKMGNVIQAEGSLPLQVGSKSAPGKVAFTLQKNADNATVIQISDTHGTSTLIASPIEESNLLF